MMQEDTETKGNTPFVDFLHRDEFSLKCALGNTKRILPLLKERGQTRYAVANYGEISGWVQQLFACREAGIVPILGMEAYLNDYRATCAKPDEILVERLTDGVVRKLLDMPEEERDLVTIDYPICLYARTLEGYYNVIRIHNDAQLNGMDRRPRTSTPFVSSHGKGVVAVLPPYSEATQLLFNGRFREAKECFRRLAGIFDEVYMAVPLVEDDGYREIDDAVVSFCAAEGIPMIPVCNSHYIRPEEEDAFGILRKLSRQRGGVTYDIDETPGMFYRTREEVDELYERRFRSKAFPPEAYAAMQKTLDELAESFQLLDIDCSLKLPKFEDGPAKLRAKAEEGFRARGYDRLGDEYRRRLDYELENIVGAGFADYFLVLNEFYDWYRNDLHSFCAFGRGSAAGSLVLNCLGCTNVDPIKYNLLFERFLDAERFRMIVERGGKVSGADCPDVDSDVATNKRDLVKRHFAERYGEKCTASIGTVGLMKTKSTLKDLARLFEVPQEEINAVTAGEMKGEEVDEDEEGAPIPLEDLLAKFPGLAALMGKYPRMADAFTRLRGSITSWGVHAGGVLITDFDLTKALPLRRSEDGKLVTCWQEGIASRELGMMGFIKFDILAIDQLNIIEDTLRLIEERTGRHIDPYEIPLDDPKALRQMESHDSLCIFQFDTELAAKVSDSMHGIRSFEDLGALSTLMRPAALRNGFDREFGERRDRPGGIYVPKCLEPFLAGTYGLPIYQEHIMQSAMALAGFDKNDAYKFMKLIYKGKLHTQAEKDEWRGKFVEGSRRLVEAGEVRPGYPDKFFDQILAFLGYGFCASHAKAYAMYSAVGLWLKQYYPLEFLCANLSVTDRAKEKKGVAVLAQRVRYAQSKGFEVLPPDVRFASDRWTIRGKALVAPLSNINGFGEADARTVIANRPYQTASEFLDKTGLSKGKFQKLVLAGALDCFGDREFLYNWYDAVYADKNRRRKTADRTLSLFGDDGDAGEDLEVATPLPRRELERAFSEMNGFAIAKPLSERFGEWIAEHPRVHSLKDVLAGKTGKRFLVLCEISKAEPFVARSTGAEYVRLVLQDGADSFDTVVKALSYRRHEKALAVGNVAALPCVRSEDGKGIYLEDLDDHTAEVVATTED